MKIGKLALLNILLVPIAFSAATYCFGGELITPTRSLREPGKTWGGLIIFSEPPQLDVYLDGEKVGQTPLWLREVETGVHTVRIAQAETSVRVEKDKRVKIGLFKGTFVTSREEKEKPTIERQQKEPAVAPSPKRPEEEERKGDLRDWEKFVNGTLKFF